ncbi:hypothetical protein MG296_04090 [Flavobacteriaceae bacterium TK19130]|nr:hypothetical protein [Thermobacterium salinum]
MRYFIVIFLSTFTFTTAQTEFSLEDFEMPESPAFVLLDEAPSIITRPNSSQALALHILQNFEGSLFNDIAVSFTPYWFIKDKDKNPLRYYGITAEGEQNPFSKLNKATISAAYNKTEDSITNVALGARVTLFELKRQSDVLDLQNAHNEAVAYTKIVSNLRIAFQQESGMIPGEDGFDEAFAAYKTEKLQNFERDSITILDVLHRKPMLAVDAAVGYNHRFSGDTFNNGETARFGAWTTAVFSSYLNPSASKNYLNIYAFARYLHDETLTSPLLNNSEEIESFDLGIKAEFEFERLTFGYEYISRSGDGDTYRSAGNIGYRLSDALYLSGTFGNNFGETDDLITLFGIRWGFTTDGQQLPLADTLQN